MVACRTHCYLRQCDLSVLALSSRFDGLIAARMVTTKQGLSVLALSSRFDGRWHFRYLHRSE